MSSRIEPTPQPERPRKAKWVTPAMARLDADDAGFGAGAAPDGPYPPS